MRIKSLQLLRTRVRSQMSAAALTTTQTPTTTHTDLPRHHRSMRRMRQLQAMRMQQPSTPIATTHLPRRMSSSTITQTQTVIPSESLQLFHSAWELHHLDTWVDWLQPIKTIVHRMQILVSKTATAIPSATHASSQTLAILFPSTEQSRLQREIWDRSAAVSMRVEHCPVLLIRHRQQ